MIKSMHGFLVSYHIGDQKAASWFVDTHKRTVQSEAAFKAVTR
ncbi:MAG: hypothetical protein AAF492_22800 [Verrucomicrobiota bacterium]